MDNIVKFGVEVLGDSYKNTLVTGFSDRETDLLTRVSFKVQWHHTSITNFIGCYKDIYSYIITDK